MMFRAETRSTARRFIVLKILQLGFKEYIWFTQKNFTSMSLPNPVIQLPTVEYCLVMLQKHIRLEKLMTIIKCTYYYIVQLH